MLLGIPHVDGSGKIFLQVVTVTIGCLLNMRDSKNFQTFSKHSPNLPSYFPTHSLRNRITYIETYTLNFELQKVNCVMITNLLTPQTYFCLLVKHFEKFILRFVYSFSNFAFVYSQSGCLCKKIVYSLNIATSLLSVWPNIISYQRVVY